MIIRLELGTCGRLINNDQVYNSLITNHAFIIIFFIYSDFLNIEFDSFMISTDQLELGGFRLLDVDNRCILPFNYPVRILTMLHP
ncbi:Cytochrome c oxidase subunit 2 [Trachymyrmex zeteki]|uniref:Cytochrome c oxidase subunit 2 n=1 Tax=Mycetomoellerius zeteki TaxID=64791 RepID=A0A151WIZ7_9HYME|nr:Cytochrome c oxidase subunit 2 [Trachymyrmex zeteki]